jgi:acetylglutamate kinase
MRLVVKIGGAALDNKELVHRFADSVAQLTRLGHQVVVVHGGGAALTRTLKELGRQSQFIDGLRVTDSQTRDVAIMVLAGHLNKQLTAAIVRAGQPAIGMCGGDLRLCSASKKRTGPDLGFVGEVTSVNAEWIEKLWQTGVVPVVATIALGADGEYYNVNADQFASACAIGCKANALVFFTDVPGVKGEDGAVIRWLPMDNIDAMVRQSTVSGGMLPKLEACMWALRRGVHRVRILPATSVEVLPRFFTQKSDLGTEVVIR